MTTEEVARYKMTLRCRTVPYNTLVMCTINFSQVLIYLFTNTILIFTFPILRYNIIHFVCCDVSLFLVFLYGGLVSDRNPP